MTATPLYFGKENQLFGWYYPPSGQATRACNVVLCRPFGHEYINSYRGFRILAQRLAAQGFPVLSFDYFGTGNSAGDENDAHLLHQWVDSVAAAADEIQRRVPGNPLAFIGLRFGASLAALTAIARTDVDALVLWEPCVSGKSYMRQMKMFAATTGQPEHVAEQRAASLGIEAAGFAYRNATVDTISGVQLANLSPITTKRALILSRDDVAVDAKLPTRFRAVGIATEERLFSGYNEFITATFRSVVPETTINEIVQWLADAYAERSGTTTQTPVESEHATGTSTRAETRVLRNAPNHTSHTVSASGVPIREQAVRFGNRLFGILTTPEKHDIHKPAVILLNTGADHHVGPHRMYVPFARDWAAHGFPVLRFDLSGLGDSPAHKGALENDPYPDRALADIVDAATYMRDQGYPRVILVGVCSGAYQAIHAAHAGAPVVGTIAVNPPLFYKKENSPETGSYWADVPHWVESEATRIQQSMFDPEKWLRFITGKVNYQSIFSVFGNKVRIAAGQTRAHVARLFSSEDHIDPKAQVLALFPPDVHSHLIYSQGDPGLIYLTRSIGKKFGAFKARDHVSIEIVDGADHTFMATHLQSRLAQLMTHALYTRFHAAPTPPSRLGQIRDTTFAKTP